MDEGPQAPAAISARLWPDGTPGRGARKGHVVPKNLGSIRTKLNALADSGQLQRGEESRYAVKPDIGRVWVLYVGSQRGYVGVYDASLKPTPLTSDPAGAVAFRILQNIGESWRLGSQTVLKRCLNELADIVLSAHEHGPPAGALVIGLPAALSLDNRRIRGDGRPDWNDQQPTIDSIVEKTWEELRSARSRELRRARSRQGGIELPDLPRAPDGTTLALTADTDIVLDTLGAMYDPNRIDAAAPDPRRARLVLGIKHSVDVRSTVIARGRADLYLDREHRRGAGERRDVVYRGAFGDTIGLGHSIALVQRASRKTRELALADKRVIWEDSAQYHARRVKEQRACSCGSIDPPHLNEVASYSAIEDRLKNAGLPVTPEDIWEGVYREIDKATSPGIRGRLILEEAGRLLAYALDNGIRLYDPEAILVTGKMVFNDIFWSIASETTQVSARRCLRRAADIPGDDVKRPIGPRGAAWLGFDTWVFPARLATLDAAPPR